MLDCKPYEADIFILAWNTLKLYLVLTVLFPWEHVVHGIKQHMSAETLNEI